jgi:ABC-2 type transport system permease protein
MTMPEARAAGEIYDLGYRGYSGAKLGRSHAIRTLIAHSLRTAFGIGRGTRAKVVPAVCVAVVMIPVFVQVGIASAVGNPAMINYATHLQFTAFWLALFTAAQAPELLVGDRQYGVLTLYMARPLTVMDYILSKSVAMILAMLIITLGPELVLFLGRVFSDPAPWVALETEYTKLGPILGGTFLASCLFALLGLALSSFTSRRAYATATVVAFFLFLPAATGLIRNVAAGDLRRFILLANPMHLMTGFVNWLFEVEMRRRSTLGRAEIPGETFLYVILAVCLLCAAILILRYRRLET